MTKYKILANQISRIAISNDARLRKLGRENSNRSDREKWSTSEGGPVFSKLFWLDQTDPLSFGPKFPEILVEWIAPEASLFGGGRGVEGTPGVVT